MAGEWIECTLAAACSSIDYGLTASAADHEAGPRFLRITDIVSGHIDWNTVPYVAADDETIAKFRLYDGDIVLARTGASTGVSAYVKNPPPAVYASYLVRLQAKPDFDPRFLAYYLKSDDFWTFIRGVLGDKSAQPNASASTMTKAPLRAPKDKHEQRAIAHILGTLDNKIELNCRMNETLEAMARAIFKSWFVDFDPVRAKAEGCDPGIPKPLAALFPDSFENAELGEIPKGWSVGKLGNILEQRVERCVASVETAARPYLTIDRISSKSLFLAESKPGVEAQSSLTKFFKKDLLFGAMRPYFHKVCIAPFDGTTRTTAFVLFPKKREDFSFSTLLLHHPDTIDYATRHSTGSTIPYAVWSGSLEDMPVILPPYNVRKEFDGIVRPILDRIPVPYYQNKTLAAIRDTLLLKLLSGEIRIKDAEKFVGRGI